MQAFIALGRHLGEFTRLGSDYEDLPGAPFSRLREAVVEAYIRNGWFTLEEVKASFESWAEALKEENVLAWTGRYDFTDKPAKKTGLILAGNIPLVGLHDVLCVLISGNRAVIKLSSGDAALMKAVLEILCDLEPELKERISFSNSLKDVDAVIATGTDNSSRYFDYYFRNVPHIFRMNRSSVAVLTGRESGAELEALGKDIFRYFGLGCRNVSKIFVPEGYDFNPFFEAVFSFSGVINNKKYGNNYDYNRAVYLMNSIPLLDNNFLLLKEDSGIHSPVGVLYYEFYSSPENLVQRLKEDSGDIQVLVKNPDLLLPASGLRLPETGFGQSQLPQLWDYADGVDTLEFLLKL